MRKVANSKSGRRGNYIKTKVNAFTLIELLAIIVILAVIAVITVPIILGIVDNSKKGAVKDSAYGYKDAINKFYVTKALQDKNYTMADKTYTVEELETEGVSISGQAPDSNSWVTIEKNNVKAGCLQFGEYKVDITNGQIGEATSGTCLATCPGCKFIYTTSTLTIGTSNMPSAATDNYEDWTTGENSHPYFLGLLESTTTQGKIGRAFACGIENGTPFCLEGYDTSKWSDEANVGVLNTIFPSCNASASDSDAYCNGSSVDGYAGGNGTVNVYVVSGACYVGSDGDLYCIEW